MKYRRFSSYRVVSKFKTTKIRLKIDYCFFYNLISPATGKPLNVHIRSYIAISYCCIRIILPNSMHNKLVKSIFRILIFKIKEDSERGFHPLSFLDIISRNTSSVNKVSPYKSASYCFFKVDLFYYSPILWIQKTEIHYFHTVIILL